MPRPINKNHRYVSGLDGLRTLAVAAVLLYHLSVPGFVGGLLGVGVFFTLSGYLITTNLMRSWDERGSLGLSTFWLRRFRRLMPAVILTLSAVLILTAALKRKDLGTTFWEALSSLFYVNNWHVIFQKKSYFDNFGGPSPLSHMWSLSVEEQFYLLWPLLLLALLTIFRSRLGALAGTLLLTVGSFALMWFLAHPVGDNTRVYEGTDTRAGGLLVGAMLALWLSSRKHDGKTVLPNLHFANLAGLLGLGGVLSLILLVPQESTFLYNGGIALLSISTVLVIFAVLHQKSVWAHVLGFAPFRWIGERSYGIYLWHMPVIAFMPQVWLEKHRLWATLITVGVSVLIAALSWRLVEDPIRKHGIVEPIRKWRRGRQADREMNMVPSRPFPAFFAAGCAVVLAAIVAVGATPVALNSTSTAAPASPPAMELNPADKPVPDASVDPQAGAGDESDAQAAPSRPGTVSCTRVVHVGDSTSIGMFATGQVNTPKSTAFTTYIDYGAEEVIDSVFGARATTEGWSDPASATVYPSAIDSVTELQTRVPNKDTCWVIATGVNDAANISAGATAQYDERIEAMMDLLGPDADVMWPLVTTNTTEGHYAKANMDKFNEALKRAENKYPNLRIYDWASESRPEWFADEDFAHYNSEGNTQRAKRYAAALANAFPAEKNGAPADKKIVGSGL